MSIVAKTKETKKTLIQPTNKERLIWLFKTITQEGKHIPLLDNALMVELNKLQVAPYFDASIEQDLTELFMFVQADKDFYRKHNMMDYKPNLNFDYSHYYSDQDVVIFSDLTDDFLKEYLEDRFGIKDENEQDNQILQKTKKKQIQRPDLPNNLKWGGITIRFLDGEEVQITAREKVFHTNYELMGFQDGKTKRPTHQWDLLKAFAYRNGFLDHKNNNDLDLKTINNVTKQKQLLSEKLKRYFYTVKGDPFHKYKKENGYRIKIYLIPEHGSDMGNTLGTISDNIDNYEEDIDTDTRSSSYEQIYDSDSW